MTLVLVDGSGVHELPDSRPPEEQAAGTTALLASPDLLLHRLLLLETNPAARLEEARMRVDDLSAQSLSDLHIAIGPALADGSSWVAVIAQTGMADCLALLDDAGIEASHILPAALCLAGDGPRAAQLGGQILFRTADHAGMAEAELLAMLPDGLPEASQEFAPTFDHPGLCDLRQGAFALRYRWWRMRRWQVAIAGLVLLALLLIALPPVLAQQRQSRAIAAIDAEVISLAERHGVKVGADAARAAAGLHQLRQSREGPALGAKLGVVVEAVAATPGASIAQMSQLPDGGLILQMEGSAAAINQLRPRLQAGPFISDGEGARLTLGQRRQQPVGSGPALAQATARLQNAASDAAIIELLQAAPRADPATALANAGLDDAITGHQIDIAAVRAPVLLPLLARLADGGTRFLSLVVGRNSDDTVSTQAEIEP